MILCEHSASREKKKKKIIDFERVYNSRFINIYYCEIATNQS